MNLRHGLGRADEPESGEGNEVQPDEGFWQALIIAGKTAEAGAPGEGALNGLITNDKFCLTRTGQLQLSWPHARRGLREPARAPLSGVDCSVRLRSTAAEGSALRPAAKRRMARRSAASASKQPALKKYRQAAS